MSDLFSVESHEELSIVQKAFFEIIANELDDNDRLRPDTRIPDLISPNDKLSATERIEIYARQYWWRLLQSLEEDFPVLQRVLGVERFNVLLKKYISECPSQSYTLRHLGRKLPKFIDHFIAADLDSDLRLLASDVATFELFQNESFFAADGNSFNAANLQSESPEKLLFLKQPHVFPLKLSYPLHEYYHFFKKSSLRDNETNAFSRDTSVETEKQLLIPAQKTLVVLYRYGTQVFAKEINEFEFEFLTYISTPRTLNEIFGHFMSMDGNKVSETEIYNIFRKSAELHWIHSPG